MSEIQIIETFSKNLARMIDEDNILQEDLAKEIGVSQQSISRYVNGDCMPSIFTLIKLSEVLFCSLDDFFK